jgi:hypothetical protein
VVLVGQKAGSGYQRHENAKITTPAVKSMCFCHHGMREQKGGDGAAARPQRYLEFDLLLMDVDVSLLRARFVIPIFTVCRCSHSAFAILLMDVMRLDYGI